MKQEVVWTLNFRPEDPRLAGTSVASAGAAGVAPVASGSSLTTGSAGVAPVVTASFATTEEASSKPSKRARLTAVHLQETLVTIIGSDATASAGGVSPQHCKGPSWLLQKAVKLLRWDQLDDPASAKYAPLGGAPPLHSGTHSKAWKVTPKGPKGNGCSASVIVKCYDDSVRQEILKEVDMLFQLCHPNIVKMVDVASINKVPSLITEYGGDDLAHLIRKQSAKYEKGPVACWFSSLIRQLFCGMHYVHSQNVIHTDLKPGNMVVDRGVLRLIDFGCAIIDLPGHRRVQRFDDVRARGLHYGTPQYKAIELLLGDRNFGKAIDVWAIGCILFELPVFKMLFSRETTSQEMVHGCIAYLGQVHKLRCLSELPKFDSALSQIKPACADFWMRINTAGAIGTDVGRIAIQLLNINAAERPSMEGCIALWEGFCGAERPI